MYGSLYFMDLFILILIRKSREYNPNGRKTENVYETL